MPSGLVARHRNRWRRTGGRHHDAGIARTGHPTIAAADEVACDESGWEGANLVAGRSPVIAYASVRLSAEAATAWLSALDGRAGRLRREYKASHVLRADRSAVAALLDPAGPVHGHAFVHLTEKTHFVVGRVLDLVLGRSAGTASAGLATDPRLDAFATTLSREGPAVFGTEDWRAFLAAANALLRDWKPRHVREPVDTFLDLVESFAKRQPAGPLGAVLDELRHSRPDAYTARARLLERHVLQPAVEPLIPALARTVLHWSRGRTADVSIVHDEQSALTERRIQRLRRRLLPPERTLCFRQVDSRTDPRVQVADVLAGVARRLATDALHGDGDGPLNALLRPYLDPASCWSHEASWSHLGPAR